MVSTPRRISSLQAAVPMKPAPPSTSARVIYLYVPGDEYLYVPGDEVDVDAVDRAQPVGHLRREHDRAMAPAGAPERDHKVHAALLVVQRHQVGHHSMQV